MHGVLYIDSEKMSFIVTKFFCRKKLSTVAAVDAIVPCDKTFSIYSGCLSTRLTKLKRRSFFLFHLYHASGEGISPVAVSMLDGNEKTFHPREENGMFFDLELCCFIVIFK